MGRVKSLSFGLSRLLWRVGPEAHGGGGGGGGGRGGGPGGARLQARSAARGRARTCSALRLTTHAFTPPSHWNALMNLTAPTPVWRKTNEVPPPNHGTWFRGARRAAGEG